MVTSITVVQLLHKQTFLLEGWSFRLLASQLCFLPPGHLLGTFWVKQAMYKGDGGGGELPVCSSLISLDSEYKVYASSALESSHQVLWTAKNAKSLGCFGGSWGGGTFDQELERISPTPDPRVFV